MKKKEKERTVSLNYDGNISIIKTKKKKYQCTKVKLISGTRNVGNNDIPHTE